MHMGGGGGVVGILHVWTDIYRESPTLRDFAARLRTLRWYIRLVSHECSAINYLKR